MCGDDQYHPRIEPVHGRYNNARVSGTSLRSLAQSKFWSVLSYPRCRASNRRDGERETR
jgi:hypothetical protein